MNKRERIEAINKRLAELKGEIGEATEERLAAITKEKDELVAERAQLVQELRAEAMEGFEDGDPVDLPDPAEKRTEKEKLEKRARDLMSKRAISIDSVDLLSATGQSDSMNPSFTKPSNLVDAIGIKSRIGIEQYDKAYVKTTPEGTATAEGATPATTEPTFGYASITRAKITAYAELPEEVEKLAPQMYVTEVQNALSMALKIRLGKQILLGSGAANNLTGINNASAIEGTTDLVIDTIDEDTLNTIIFSYGGDEELSPGVLILSKGALLDFSKVRGTNEKRRVYDIDYKNKTIDGIPYIINSAYNAPADAGLSEVYMAFGSLSNYELVAFAKTEMKKSDDYKFKEGQTSYKAVGIFGGNVAAYNGFIRVKKAAA